MVLSFVLPSLSCYMVVTPVMPLVDQNSAKNIICGVLPVHTMIAAPILPQTSSSVAWCESVAGALTALAAADASSMVKNRLRHLSI